MLRFYVQAEVKVTKASHMDELVNSDTRIILLYSTKVATIISTPKHLLTWAAIKPGTKAATIIKC